MHGFRRFGLILLLGVVCCAHEALASDAEGYFEERESGGVQWTSGLATAKGAGAPPPGAANASQTASDMALKAATVVSRRKLLDLVKELRLDASSTLASALAGADSALGGVRGLIQNSLILDTATLEDGAVEVTSGIYLRGAFLDALLPKSVLFKLPPDPAQNAANATQTPAASGPSGLVIEAAGLGAKPALLPRVFDANGLELYGPNFAQREYALKEGLAAYARGKDKGAEKRVGERPLRVKAASLKNPAGVDLVLDDVSAEALKKAAASPDFLEKCRVLILID